MPGSLDVGDRAPDFTLPRSAQEKVTLSDVLKDRRAVLIFYVLDFTGA